MLVQVEGDPSGEICALQVLRRLTTFFESIGVKHVFDTTDSRDLSLVETAAEFVSRYRAAKLPTPSGTDDLCLHLILIRLNTEPAVSNKSRVGDHPHKEQCMHLPLCLSTVATSGRSYE